MRSDYEAQIRDLNKNEDWQKNWQNGRFFVTPMNREELQQIIEEPAEQRTLVFESPRLVNKLIDEVIGMQGALPLLSFALSELYLKYLKAEEDDRRKDRIITEKDYEELGGVTRSLTNRANEVYDNLVGQNLACKINRETYKSASPKSAYEDTVRRVMLRMVSLQGGELARRQVPKPELVYTSKQENERVQEVIKCFSEARLIVAGSNSRNEPYIEPAHDALVLGWDKLLAWSREEEESLILQRRLTSEAVKWKHEASKPQQLSNFQRIVKPPIYWLDSKLNVVENFFDKINPRIDNKVLRWWDGDPNIIKPSKYLWDDDVYIDKLDKTLNSDSDKNWLNKVEAEFVNKSVAKKQRNHKWRWRIAVSVSSVITITAIIASIQWISAQKRLISTIDALTEASQQLFDSNQEFDALLTSIRAGKQAKQAAFWVVPEANRGKTEYRIKTQLQQSLYWGKELNRLEGHEAGVRSISFSPNRKQLASVSVDGTIKLWNAYTGELIKNINTPETPNGHKTEINFVTFSPSGQLLASASSIEKNVKLWDIDTGNILTIPEYETDTNGSKGVSFSPHQQIVAITSKNNTIKLRDSATGKLIAKLQGHEEGVNSVSFSPDGKLLASGGFDDTVKFWDVYECIKNFQCKEITSLQQKKDVFSVNFSPNGEYLASANDRIVKLWNVDECIRKPQCKKITFRKEHKEHQDRVTTLSFSPDGKMLASVGFDDTVKLWNLNTGQIDSFTGHQGDVTGISFHPDGNLLASSSADNTIKIWHIGDRQEMQKFTRHGSKINSISFSRDGKFLASASDGDPDNNNIKLCDLRKYITKKYKCEGQEVHKQGVIDIDFHISEPLLASGSWDTKVKIWNITNPPKQAKTLEKEDERDDDWVKSVSFSPSQPVLASADRFGQITLWDTKIYKEITTFQAHDSEIPSISFSPDGKLLASGSYDKTIKLWDIIKCKKNRQCKPKVTLQGHKNGVNSVSFIPNGKLLASGSWDKTIKLWDVVKCQTDPQCEAKATLRQYENEIHSHNNEVNSVDFSSDGKYLASASSDRSIKIWDINSSKQPKEINILNGHRTGVNSISFSPDGNFLASGDESGQIAVWNYSEIISNFTLDNLLRRSCNRVHNYLKHNPNVLESDRNLCDGFKTSDLSK